jgi:serine/threonine protein kinase/WD40 repeat protein
MTPKRWARIKEVFNAAQEQPLSERAAWLDETCRGDDLLRAEVERLLAQDGESLPSPAGLLAQDVPALARGEMLSHYRVEAKIGQGGMGVVYRAYDVQLRRQVALKVLAPACIADPRHKRGLLREARAASALSHPNIVAIYEIGSDGVDFIAMEFIDGKSLNEVIPSKGLPVVKALDYAMQIASGLAKAHAAGVIHRDLKPRNIMLTPEGRVKLLDFGLARQLHLKGQGSTQTVDGCIVGTPAYMSPEQVRGGKIDQRSDIFSFGLVLHEMLSGRQAFRGGSAIEVMNAILSEEPAALPDAVPAGIRRIVADCLAKEPVSRFESSRDLSFALPALSASSPSATPTFGIDAMARTAWWRLALGVLVLVTGLVATRYLVRPEPVDLSTYKFEPLATDSEEETSGSWSRDGKSIAYLKAIDGWPQVMLRNLEAPSAVQLTKFPSGVYSWAAPFFSSDAEQVYFIAGDRLWSVAAVGGEPREVLAAPMQVAALSPDGKTLAFWGRYEEAGKQYFSVWISSPPGAPPRKYEPAPFRMEVGVFPNYLRFSPDGSKLGLSTFRVGGASFWVLPWPDGPKARPNRPFPPKMTRYVPSFDWMPNSRHVCLAPDLSLWMGDTETGKLRRMTAAASGLAWEPSVSPGGERILFTSTTYDTDILELPLDGSPPRPLLATARSESSPSWSTAGDVMAFLTDRSGESAIWLRNPDGGWERPVVRERDFAVDAQESLRSDALSLQNVVLSPDGKRLAFCRRGRQWVSSASGGHASLAATGNEVGTGAPSWSPDGSSIVFLGLSGGRLHLAVVRIGDQQPPFLIPDTADQCASAPVWSPDGHWIACGGRDQSILLVSPDGKQRRRLQSPARAADNNFVLVWSRDAETLYVASSPAPKARLDAISVRTGESRRIAEYRERLSFRTTAAYSLSGSLSRDGKSIATTVFNSKSDLWILEGYPQPRHRWLLD